MDTNKDTMDMLAELIKAHPELKDELLARMTQPADEKKPAMQEAAEKADEPSVPMAAAEPAPAEAAPKKRRRKKKPAARAAENSEDSAISDEIRKLKEADEKAVRMAEEAKVSVKSFLDDDEEDEIHVPEVPVRKEEPQAKPVFSFESEEEPEDIPAPKKDVPVFNLDDIIGTGLDFDGEDEEDEEIPEPVMPEPAQASRQPVFDTAANDELSAAVAAAAAAEDAPLPAEAPRKKRKKKPHPVEQKKKEETAKPAKEKKKLSLGDMIFEKDDEDEAPVSQPRTEASLRNPVAEGTEREIARLGKGYEFEYLTDFDGNTNATLTDRNLYFQGKTYYSPFRGKSLFCKNRVNAAVSLDSIDSVGFRFTHRWTFLLGTLAFIIFALKVLGIMPLTYVPGDSAVSHGLNSILYSIAGSSVLQIGIGIFLLVLAAAMLIPVYITRETMYVEYQGGRLEYDIKKLDESELNAFYESLMENIRGK